MYIGGHKAFPQPALSEIFFHEDRFELEPYHISVQYSKIKDIANSNDMKRDTERLWAGLIFPPVAFSIFMEKESHLFDNRI